MAQRTRASAQPIEHIPITATQFQQAVIRHRRRKIIARCLDPILTLFCLAIPVAMLMVGGMS